MSGLDMVSDRRFNEVMAKVLRDDAPILYALEEYDRLKKVRLTVS